MKAKNKEYIKDMYAYHMESYREIQAALKSNIRALETMNYSYQVFYDDIDRNADSIAEAIDLKEECRWLKSQAVTDIEYYKSILEMIEYDVRELDYRISKFYESNN